MYGRIFVDSIRSAFLIIEAVSVIGVIVGVPYSGLAVAVSCLMYVCVYLTFRGDHPMLGVVGKSIYEATRSVRIRAHIDGDDQPQEWQLYEQALNRFLLRPTIMNGTGLIMIFDLMKKNDDCKDTHLLYISPDLHMGIGNLKYILWTHYGVPFYQTPDA